MAEPTDPAFRPMHDPPHPGLSIRIDCLEPAGLTVTEGAKALGVSRQALSKLVNGTAGISPEMALRLAKAFGSTPDMWLRLQMAYDLAQAVKREPEITRDVRPVTTAA
jgi:antitoxin HigA-1